MRIIENRSVDPYFNLAAEEYLLEYADTDVFMLWRNQNAVVIGRNQNAWAEVNVPYTEEHGISVVRRLSGGGAVFHDLGNVNFTYITTPPLDRTIDFSRFTAPILQALSELGVQAAADGRNDLTAGGAKISGNAQCVFRRQDGSERLLHHGTLLLGADLSHLSGALLVSPEKIRSKGIASVRSRVANLRDIPGFPAMTTEAFMQHLLHCAERQGDAFRLPLTQAETEGILVLREKKYQTWEWNFGASMRHDASCRARFPFGGICADFSVREGKIHDLRLHGDYFGCAPVSVLEHALEDVPLREDALRQAMQSLPSPVGEYIAGAQMDDLTALLLGRLETEK